MFQNNRHKLVVLCIFLVTPFLTISFVSNTQKKVQLKKIDMNKAKHFLHSQNQEEQIYALKELGKIKTIDAIDTLLFFLCTHQNTRLQIQASIELVCVRTDYAKEVIKKIMVCKNKNLQEYLLFAYQVKANKEDVSILKFFLSVLPEKDQQKVRNIIAKL